MNKPEKKTQVALVISRKKLLGFRQPWIGIRITWSKIPWSSPLYATQNVWSDILLVSLCKVFESRSLKRIKDEHILKQFLKFHAI